MSRKPLNDQGHDAHLVRGERMSQLIIILLLLLAVRQPVVHAEVVGTYGITYGIAERDALVEIQDRAKKVNWSAAIDKKAMERKLKEYIPQGLPAFPVAKENRTFLRDMTYTTEIDVPDGNGGILYPKGYTFNPLEYVSLPSIIVFIDGSDKKQTEWFERSPYLRDVRTMVILTGGSYYELSKHFKRPVYFAVRNIARRFGIEHVPSVAMQKGKYMEISEYVPDILPAVSTTKKAVAR